MLWTDVLAFEPHHAFPSFIIDRRSGLTHYSGQLTVVNSESGSRMVTHKSNDLDRLPKAIWSVHILTMEANSHPISSPRTPPYPLIYLSYKKLTPSR